MIFVLLLGALAHRVSGGQGFVATPAAPMAPPTSLPPRVGQAEASPPSGQSEATLRSYLRRTTDVARIIRVMGLKEGDRIVDVGAGAGFFTWPFSRAVGETGRVVAVDVDPAAIRFLQERAERERLPFANVEILQTRSDNICVRANSMDWAFLSAAHFFLDEGDQSQGCVASIFGALRPGGRAAVIESKQNPMYGEVPLARVAADFLRAGFTLEKTYGFLPGDHFVIFRKR